jgi:hypothetical protein
MAVLKGEHHWELKLRQFVKKVFDKNRKKLAVACLLLKAS